MENLYGSLLKEVRERRDKGINRQCFADKILDEQATTWQFTELELKNLFGILLEGGSDTTAGTILLTLQALTEYPEEQRKVQREIDEHIGEERSPVRVFASLLARRPTQTSTMRTEL